MNTIAETTAHNREESNASKCAKCFLDENGRPSERSGPDLTKAKPIKRVAAYIKSQRTQHRRRNAAYHLIEALKASGIGVHAGWNASLRQVREGTDKKDIGLQIGFPCDAQESLRRERYDVLYPLMEDLRNEMIDLMLEFGEFTDLRPYATGEDAVNEVVAAGARIYKIADGEISLALPLGRAEWENDRANGWRLRRAAHRFSVSLSCHRDEIGKIVEAEGERQGGGYSLNVREMNHAR